jgi:hypothetical protein
VRITVDFTVGGAPQDPDFGLAASSGSFSVVTTIAPGPVVTRHSGFGADQLSFSWAGASWTTANADVVLLARDAGGAVSLWWLGGAPSGFAAVSYAVWPDFRVGFCAFCGPESETEFYYTTPRTRDVGIYTGRVLSFSMRTEPAPAPVPEPMSLLLITGGLAGLVARRTAFGNPRTGRAQ